MSLFALLLLLTSLLLLCGLAPLDDDDDDVRLALAIPLCLAAGGHILQRFRLFSLRLVRTMYVALVAITFLALVAFNDPFYRNTAGRALDPFFPRPFFALDLPGAGFDDWAVTWWRRNAWWVLEYVRVVRNLAVTGLVLVTVPPVVVGAHWVRREWMKPSLADAMEWVTEHPEDRIPPWLRQPVYPMAEQALPEEKPVVVAGVVMGGDEAAMEIARRWATGAPRRMFA